MGKVLRFWERDYIFERNARNEVKFIAHMPIGLNATLHVTRVAVLITRFSAIERSVAVGIDRDVEVCCRVNSIVA